MNRALITLFAALAAGAAAAQDAFPSKPITMIVPFPPGGVADIVGRPLASVMQKSLKHPVVVVNRTGAGGAVGMAAVAKSAPDGYTILMGLSSISIFPVSDVYFSVRYCITPTRNPAVPHAGSATVQLSSSRSFVPE